MNRREILELLKRIDLHHTTTSIPLASDRYGSVEAVRAEGRQLWGHDVPAAIQAIATDLANDHKDDTGAGFL